MLPTRLLFALTALLALPLAGRAQTPPAAPSAPCSCRADLDAMVDKIERNYIAWHLEYKGTPRELDFRRFVAGLQARADATSSESCIFLVRELSDWFHDGHLFVIEYPAVSTDDAARLIRETETRTTSEPAVRADLARRAGTLDPIEGLWYAAGLRLAIVPATTASATAFVAIVLSSDSTSWLPGQVRATFMKRPNGRYETVARADDHSIRHVESELYRHVLLAVGAESWGRAAPLAPHETGTVHATDPGRPTFRLVGRDAAVITVPSHDPQYTVALESLVRANAAALAVRPLLVIDIRGDLGGGSQTTNPLLPMLVSATMRAPIGPKGLSTVVSSPDNIRYFQRGWNPDSIATRMAAAPGQVMPLMRDETLGLPFPKSAVLSNPTRVAVLMDHGVASAGEAFALQARQSTKVTLYGENSHGMIDYQSVTLVRLACRVRGLLLGYPMIAASATLPKDGLNAKGVPADVAVPHDVPDQVSWVLEHMRRARR